MRTARRYTAWRREDSLLPDDARLARDALASMRSTTCHRATPRPAQQQRFNGGTGLGDGARRTARWSTAIEHAVCSLVTWSSMTGTCEAASAAAADVTRHTDSHLSHGAASASMPGLTPARRALARAVHGAGQRTARIGICIASDDRAGRMRRFGTLLHDSNAGKAHAPVSPTTTTLLCFRCSRRVRLQAARPLVRSSVLCECARLGCCRHRPRRMSCRKASASLEAVSSDLPPVQLCVGSLGLASPAPMLTSLYFWKLPGKFTILKLLKIRELFIFFHRELSGCRPSDRQRIRCDCRSHMPHVNSSRSVDHMH